MNFFDIHYCYDPPIQIDGIMSRQKIQILHN